MDQFTIIIILFLVAFIGFQIFQGRKRRRETENRQTMFVPGVEIMTNYGLYGTIVSIDDERNLAVIETVPGTQLKIHRQTILKVADYDTLASNADADDVTDADDERVDGERTDDAAPRAVSDDRIQLNTDSAIRHDADTSASSDGPRFTEPRFGELRDDRSNPSRSTDKSGDQ